VDAEEEDDESALQALILKRAEKRKADSSSFLASLATKYGAVDETPKKGKGKKRTPGETGEEEKEDDVTASPRKKSRTVKTALPEIDDTEFAAIQARLFGPKASGKTGAHAAASGGSKKTRKGKPAS
jgi:DnaJ family protein C protein 9